MSSPPRLLDVDHLDVFYDRARILRQLSLHVNAHEIVALIGPNGAGKTTLLRTLQGLLPPADGAIRFAGERVDSVPAHQRVARGLVLVPEAGHLFLDMTVRENLELGAHNPRARAKTPALIEGVYELFPMLREKQRDTASSLSGGQQRMLVIGRGLMAQPRLLLLDDPFLGLAREVVDRTCETLSQIKRDGVTVLIAGQNVRRLLQLSDRAYLIDRGRVVLEGSGADLLEDPQVYQLLLAATTRS